MIYFKMDYFRVSYLKKMMTIAVILSSLIAGNAYKAEARQSSNACCEVECQTCASVCEKTLNYCLKQGGKHINAAHVKTLRDCISTCKQSADFMERGSKLQNSACALCEKACRTCAQSCAAFKDDKTMQACAQECNKCADVCSKMAD